MNIILIGFMGVGKSEVGQKLADKLNLKFLDSDNLIEESEQMKISEIFKTNGEKYFRGLETQVVKTLLNYDSFVISTGGGIVLKEENVKMLKKIGSLVLLTATPEVIFDRTKTATNRPLLEQGDKLQKIKEILEKRDPIYQGSADFIVDTSDKNIDTIVEEILNYVKSKG